MLDRNPLAGPRVRGKDTDQPCPGTDEERPAQPVEIAAGFVYLAPADARYVSGEVLAITGKTSTR